ncbi:MAG: hypothetical protein MUO42_05900 [Anaerolineaceae bacterium]|nr:hypothetical protein [Anaerolineaceae bacterium]
MNEKCWFCKKNPKDPASTFVFPLRKLTDTQWIAGNSYRNIYSIARVRVPRCGKCAEAHTKVKFYRGRGWFLLLLYLSLNFFTSLGWITGQKNALVVYAVLMVPLIILGFIWGPPALKTKQYLLSVGVLPESEKNKYPELNSKLGQGFESTTQEEINKLTPISADDLTSYIINIKRDR